MVNRWTSEELASLKEQYSNIINQELSLLFVRHSISSILDKAHELGLRKSPTAISHAISRGWRKSTKARANRQAWNDHEIEILTDLYPHATMRKLRDKLPDRSEPSIWHKGERLGLKRLHNGRFRKGFKRTLNSRLKQAKTISGEHNVSKRSSVRDKISNALKGQLHPWAAGERNHNWRGGREPYYGTNWRSQSRKALKRDGYACQKCSAKEDLGAHHIKPFRLFGRKNYREANQLDNLMTLCRSCHSVETNHERV